MFSLGSSFVKNPKVQLCYMRNESMSWWQLTLHVLSKEPETIREESQLNWTLLISPLWPIKVWRRLGEKQRAAIVQTCTQSLCTFCLWWHICQTHAQVNAYSAVTMRAYLPEATSHIATVWSKEPVTSLLPNVLKHKERTSAVWPWVKTKRQYYHCTSRKALFIYMNIHR